MEALRYCAQCNVAFTSTHHSKRFCTIMCQVKYARLQKTLRDRSHSLTGGEIAAREQAFKDAVAQLPRQEGQPSLPPSPMSRRIAPMEGPGIGQDEFRKIAPDYAPKLEGYIVPDVPGIKPEDDPSFWEEAPEEEAK